MKCKADLGHTGLADTGAAVAQVAAVTQCTAGGVVAQAGLGTGRQQQCRLVTAALVATGSGS